jgi:2-oxoglutarate ferredoxin oxidoreductase subunit gamma
MNTQIRFAGVGSQGLVSASVVLAEGLGIVRDYEVVQTQFYAASIQGGASCGDVIFGRDKIVFPWVLAPDVLVALAQDAVKAHAAAMRPGSQVLCDERTVNDLTPFGPEVVVWRAPLMALADGLGEMSAAVLARAPGRPDVNRQAVRLGYDAPITRAS